MVALSQFQDTLQSLAAQWPERTSDLVDQVLRQAADAGASDIHFEPTASALNVRMRLDGVLQNVAALPAEVAGHCIARLKVLAELLTYRLDLPQEGRVVRPADGLPEMRVSTFPTIYGERAVVRLFDSARRTVELERLGFPQDTLGALRSMLAETSGVLLLTGPSGSGKTTTIYACLSHLVRASSGSRHIVTLEDPVEMALEGVSQSQVHPVAGFDFACGLRSLLRQDPEVVMIGEIRDRETAQIAIEASLTGHLVISTLHSGSACGVIGRLLEMGIEPYLLTSSLKAVVNQRLLRRLCPHCGAGGDTAGCEACLHTGYRGRKLLAELLIVDDDLRRVILERGDTNTLQRRAEAQGHQTLAHAARAALEAGEVDLREVRRVLGNVSVTNDE